MRPIPEAIYVDSVKFRPPIYFRTADAGPTLNLAHIAAVNAKSEQQIAEAHLSERSYMIVNIPIEVLRFIERREIIVHAPPDCRLGYTPRQRLSSDSPTAIQKAAI